MAYTTIDDPELYFQVKTYSGTGSSLALTFDGTNDMQPDWVWFKRRDGSANHHAYDSVRGVTKALVPNDTDSETGGSQEGTLYFSSFDSDGFTLAGGNYNNSNKSGQTYVAWNWKESPTAGFDIVSYTGNNTVRTISHNLSAVPKWMIFKERDGTGNWIIYHGKNTSAPETDLLLLNTTTATIDDASAFNDTAPTSSVFTLGDGDGGGDNNQNGLSMIGYIFAEKQGFSKFGSYTGNGNSDGTYVHLGFRPAWIMIKRTDSTGQWFMHDNKRVTFNVDNKYLAAQDNASEQTFTALDKLASGFKLRTSGTGYNASGGTYIYMAFAESPFVNSNGVPTNAR